jgi:glycosyltransferase involved in cell wall biosynthesis
MGIPVSMKEKPQVTVLMSVYNGEKYLREAIDSILGQTFKDFEYLIIDDGSTDSSSDIIRSYTDSRIRLIRNEKNIGLTGSLNKGLKLAKGEYIARMDADDISLPERLEREVAIAGAHPEITVVTTGFANFVNSFREDNRDSVNKGGTDEIEWIGFEDLLEGNKIFHGSVLFKRRDVLDIGGYDERLPKAQDYDLWLRVSRKVEIIKLKRILFLRRLHFDCVSMKGILKQEYYADMVKRKNEFACRSSNKSRSLLKKYSYRKRAMLRLRGYANLFLQDNCVKQGIYLLLKSFCLYPTRSGLKQLVLVLLKDSFKLKKLQQRLVG